MTCGILFHERYVVFREVFAQSPLTIISPYAEVERMCGDLIYFFVGCNKVINDFVRIRRIIKLYDSLFRFPCRFAVAHARTPCENQLCVMLFFLLRDDFFYDPQIIFIYLYSSCGKSGTADIRKKIYDDWTVFLQK